MRQLSKKIKPFRATYYNQEIVKNLSNVISPPYDVINKKQEEVLRKKSPYNFCHTLLTINSDYQALGNKFRSWISEKVLVDDDKECLYLYEQTFKTGGKTYKRFGMLSLLNMDNKKVFPHEHTLSAPKEDRKKIIREVEANLSPIFVIISKYSKVFAKIHATYCRKSPFMRFKDMDGNDNKVWRISDADDIKNICQEVDNSSMVIADGHHRFEISYNYYQENKNKYKDLNYILSYVTDCQKGLVILPTHRIVSLGDDIVQTLEKLSQYFIISEHKASDFENKLNKTNIFSFGIYHNKKVYLLKLKKAAILDKMLTNKVYKKLDTYVLHDLVFSLVKVQGDIGYTHDLKDAIKMTDANKFAFILRPTSLEAVFDVANKGYRLPQKSTYFYPKILAGIVVRRFGL